MATVSTDAPPTAKARLELDRCVTDLLLKEPFFGHLLASVVRRVSTDLTPTAAVSISGGHVRLTVNPFFFVKVLRSRRERVAVVKHEALHLLFKHVVRRDQDKRRHPMLWNVAADLVVNQVIKPWPLPESGLTLATFPDLALKADQTADHYYEKLRSLAREMQDAAAGSPEADACPNCGGAGMPSLSAGAWKALGVKASKSAEALSGIAETWHSDHSLWGEFDDVGAEASEGMIDGIIRRTAARVGSRQWSNLPNRLRELIQAALERAKPRVDWRRVVRIFSNSSRKTRIASTLRRPSQRYGTFPGIKVKRLQRLAVGVDTSGSVGDEELSLFFAEIHGMWRAGAEVIVFECDAAVQRRYPYRGKLPTAVAGRGGTAFDPVFRALRESRMERWDGCIYLTDGHAAAPAIRPPCKVLWVVTPNGRLGEHLKFGRAVRIE